MHHLLEKKYSPYLILFALSLAFILPALVMGSSGGDLIFHQMWSRHFSEALWQGQWYPRWLPDMNAGCGSPTFFFYPPLAYFITSTFRFLNDISPVGWYPMAMTAFVTVFAGSAFMYAWLMRIVKSEVAALCAACLYIVMPYTALDFYVFMSFSEFAVIGLLPVLLFFASKMIDGERGAVGGFSIAFALLLLSNIPGLIVASGLPVLYVAFSSWTTREYKPLKRLAVALLLGTGLAAIYLVPMLTGMENIRLGRYGEEMWGGRFAFSSNFLFTLTEGDASVNILLSVIIYCCLDISFRFTRQVRRSVVATVDTKKWVLFWFCMLSLAFFMTTPLSWPVWKLIPIIQVVQFPRRIFLAISVLFCVIFAFLVKDRMEEKGKFDIVYFCMCLCLLFTFEMLVRSSQAVDLTKEISATEEAGSEKTDGLQKFQLVHKYFTLGVVPPDMQEYLPIWTEKAVMQPEQIDETAKVCARKTTVTQGQAEVQVASWKARDITLAIDAKSASVIEVSQFYYPGWRAVSESGENYSITPSPTYGLIDFSVPAGTHIVFLRLEKSVAERVGGGISLVSLLLLVLPCIFRRRLGNKFL